jgi:hypothetical protein
MPKQLAKKTSPKAAAKPARATPEKKKSVAKKAEPAAMAAPAGGCDVVHGCIVGCAGHSNFGTNTPLKNIVASAECVQACVIDATGTQVIVTANDTENSICGMIS